MTTRILIVDDHLMVIEGIKALLADTDRVTIVGTVNDAFFSSGVP